jgi:hypothetical protein
MAGGPKRWTLTKGLLLELALTMQRVIVMEKWENAFLEIALVVGYVCI